MSTQVRRVATLVLVLFAALFANLNIIQVLRANEPANHPNNRRLIVEEYGVERGPIVVGDQEIAYSEATEGVLKYRRRYESPELYAHLVGYHSLVYGRAGLEAAFNEELTGTPTQLLAENLAALLGERDPVGNTLRLTIDPDAQRTAWEALDGRTGAVVALDPRTGEVLVHVSRPSYDPNPLASHDPDEIREYWREATGDEAAPLADSATRRRYQPGSAFKIIVAAAALEHGLRADTSFEDTDAYVAPQTTRPIRNFGRGTCAGGGTITLEQSFVVSCNVVFAKLGVDLGADAVVSQAERFGFNRDVPYTLRTSRSVMPGDLDPPGAAQSAIGMRDVQATAMHMAMVGGSVANTGVLMRPYVVAEVLDPSGRRVRGPQTGPWVEGRITAQAVSPETARALSQMMVRAVEDGTGRAAQIGGARVGGKTGTADPGDGRPSHAWFVGFAGPEGGDPTVAVAVVLPSAGPDATGGRDAAPVARAVMEALLNR
jgi:penicillin-binding protein A